MGGRLSRGFADRFSNKLLVLMDGRSVCTQLFSGVYWDAQDTLLEDIERIEVIRGPEATLWGANAVNGVINIITKPARDTQGGLLSGGVGSHEASLDGARYGGQMVDETFVNISIDPESDSLDTLSEDYERFSARFSAKSPDDSNCDLCSTGFNGLILI